MKKVLSTKAISSIGFIAATILCLFSCTKSNIEERRPEISLSKYDKDLYALASAINKASQNHPEFNSLIKDEVLKQKTGDYEIVIKDIINTNISTVTKSGILSDVSVAELIESYLPATVKSSNSLEDLIESYPELQISVPVHAEDMNPASPSKIAIVPSYYKDLVTTTVPGIDENGNDISVDAINEPDEPYMVLSLPEKPDSMIFDPSLPTFPIDPSNPDIQLAPRTSIEISYVNNAVRINYDISHPEYFSISRREIHRAGPNSNTFVKIGDISNVTLSFTDWSVENGKEYSYKAVTFYMINGEEEYSDSNIETIIIDNTIPQPVENLTVTAISGGRNEIRWENHSNEQFNSQIYRRTGASDNILIATVGPNVDSYFDSNAASGEKSVYTVRKINTVSGVLSPSRYAYIYSPYRNPEGISNVILKKIHANVSEVEGWLQGKPEFYLTVYGVTSSGEVTHYGSTFDIKFSSRSDDSQELSNILYNWSYFDHISYYPTLNFHLVEYDTNNSNGSFNVNAKVGIKLLDSISLEIGGTYNITVPFKDKECGSTSLLYFENPQNRLYFPNYGAYMDIDD